MSGPDLTTRLLIYATFAAWVAWDVYAAARYGRQATESSAITGWCRRFPWVVFALGYLGGHWVGFGLQ